MQGLEGGELAPLLNLSIIKINYVFFPSLFFIIVW